VHPVSASRRRGSAPCRDEVVAVQRVERGVRTTEKDPLVVSPVRNAPQEASGVGRRIFLERAEVLDYGESRRRRPRSAAQIRFALA